jgi:hypothetical protein
MERKVRPRDTDKPVNYNSQAIETSVIVVSVLEVQEKQEV